MIYNVENTAAIGKPCTVYDANGVEVPWCVECNTETGEVTQFLCDEKGPVIKDGEIVLQKNVHPHPLELVFL